MNSALLTTAFCAFIAGAAAAWLWARRLEAAPPPLPSAGPTAEKDRPDRAATSLTRLEAALQKLPLGLVLCDLRGDPVFLNASAERDLGPTPSREKLQQVLTARAHGDRVELQAPNGDMVRRRVTVELVVPSEIEPETAGVLVVLSDESTQRRLEQAQDGAFRALADELRAPISGLGNYAALLQASLEPGARQRGYADAVADACAKLGGFVQDTLDAARIEAGHLPLGAMPADPGALVRRVFEACQSPAKVKKISLTSRLPPSPLMADLDEPLLARALGRLLERAVEVSPEGATVEISVAGSGPEHLEFSVVDHGSGISPDKKASLFDSLGGGRGLALCRSIAGLHGGTIRAVSDEKSTVFTLRLPLRRM